MQHRLLVAVFILLGMVGIAFFAFSGGAGALIVTAIPTFVLLWIFRHSANDKQFITFIFLGALLARLSFGLFVEAYDLRDFFGGDAFGYDFFGNALLERWTDAVRLADPTIDWQLNNLGTGWGMYYIVATIYLFVGRNILAAQSFCAVFGAAIAPMAYFCAQRVFLNDRVARTAAVLAAFFPAFIIWSGQLLKDGLIVFLLVLSMTMILELQRKFTYGSLLLLFGSIAGILPLRFYIFYMLAMAVVGSFVVAFSNSVRAVVRNTIVLVILGLGLTYIGITRNAGSAFDKYGSLATVQNSRSDLATAGSGFGGDVDVSTTEGAISAIPIGLTYLMLAPFPWEISSFRSAVPLPEVLVWWAMLPFMVSGIGWTLRNRLRRAFPILLFSLMLTLAYSVFQGNVGTAYRQRTQIQVFLFMFIAVAWTLRKEKAENQRMLDQARRSANAERMKARLAEVGS
jgi:hypothetical protein